MRGFALLLLASASLMLPGCVAKTLVDVATLPVRAGAKAVDLATTSQSESDENRGREIRRREEQLGKLERAYAKQRARCDEGSAEACAEARATYAEIQAVLPSIPAEPDPKR
ncbi:MAG: hypothetical protein K2Y17_11670 [Qipengyuania sp.]|jgi:hypothetical protein|nr:hypothetical protein [Qipengyuania sp.]